MAHMVCFLRSYILSVPWVIWRCQTKSCPTCTVTEARRFRVYGDIQQVSSLTPKDPTHGCKEICAIQCFRYLGFRNRSSNCRTIFGQVFNQ